MGWKDELRDPRWQKRRLKILERDKWECQRCADASSTLNVHHLWYDGEPWDVPDEALLTLCDDCHEAEDAERKDSEQRILAILRAKLPLAWQLESLAMAIAASDRAALNELGGLDALTWSIKEPVAIAATRRLCSYWHSTQGGIPQIPDPLEADEDMAYADLSAWWDAYALTTEHASEGPIAFMAFVSAHYPNGEWICGESPNDQA